MQDYDPSRFTTYLCNLGFEGVAHPRGALLPHLTGVARMLARWERPEQ